MKHHQQDSNSNYEELTIPIEEGVAKIIKYILPFSLISLFPFFIIYGFSGFKGITFIKIILFLVVVLLGIPLHELLHALIFGLFVKGGFKTLSFGIEPLTRSPWCHCNSEMSVLLYRIGAITPFFIMGMIPLFAAYVMNSPALLVFGYLYCLGGAGDWLSVYLTRKLKWKDRVKDHPSKLGFFIVKGN